MYRFNKRPKRVRPLGPRTGLKILSLQLHILCLSRGSFIRRLRRHREICIFIWNRKYVSDYTPRKILFGKMNVRRLACDQQQRNILHLQFKFFKGRCKKFHSTHETCPNCEISGSRKFRTDFLWLARKIRTLLQAVAYTCTYRATITAYFDR